MTIPRGNFSVNAIVAAHADAPMTAPSLPVDSLNDDARLYLRHIQGGETIRALAREIGCHPSTIMRRIRKFETRRDDRLVDQALSRSDPDQPEEFKQSQVVRVLRRLAEPGAELIVVPVMEKALVTRDEIRICILDRKLAEMMALRGWVNMLSQNKVLRYGLAPAGKEALRGLLAKSGGDGFLRPGDFSDAKPVTGMAEDAAGFGHGDAHRVWGERVVQDPEDGRRRRAQVNLAESPLGLLSRRRDANGHQFLGPDLVIAGERIREDFELAQMGPRVTQNWDRFLTSGISESFGGSNHFGGSETARTRVALALRELGPGMGDLVLRVCCFLEGIETTERRLGWSARSGKIVLKLALERLHRHYEAQYGSEAQMIG